MIITLYELIDKLSQLSQDIDDTHFKKNLPDHKLSEQMRNFANQPQTLNQLAMTALTLKTDRNLPLDEMNNMLFSLLNKRSFYGAYHELGVYRWLNCKSVHYVPQHSVSKTEFLSRTGTVQLDGYFEYADTYFDIKSFGFLYDLKEKFRTKLQKVMKSGVTIDGPMDLALFDIQTDALQDKEHYEALVKDLRNDGFGEIPTLDWKVRLHKGPVNFETTTVNPYRLAEENRYYPFKYANKFTCNAPFILIFAFDYLFNKTLHVNFANYSTTLFRSLCRRAFVQFNSDSRRISTIGADFASKIDGATELRDVAKLLSGILFVNIQNKQSWLYTNPNAKNRLSELHVDGIFDFNRPAEMEFDDFKYDNY